VEQASSLARTPGTNAANGKAAWLPLVALFCGVATVAFIVYFVGFDAILQPLARVGWGFFWIVTLNGARHFLRAINLVVALPRRERTFSVAEAFAARLAGETINTVAFTGPVLGDAAKAAMMNRKVKLEHSATAVIVDEIVYYISSLVLILAGAVAILSAYGAGLAVRLMLAGLVVFSFGVFCGLWWVLRREIKPIAWAIRKCRDRWFVPKYVRKRRDQICEVETRVMLFKDDRPRAFRIIVFLVIAAHFLSVVEAYVGMRLLGLDATAFNAFIVESLTKALNFTFFLIPGTVGAYEGGNGVILSLLGYTAGAGVALALVRRGAILFWTFIGGLVLLWRGAESTAEQIAESGGPAESE
jgi:hypothetical protein